MANFNGAARSNYFKGKDVEAFRAWAASAPNIVCHTKADGTVMIYSEDPDTGCWPSFYCDDEGNDAEVDLAGDIRKHLEDNQVCVLMEAGAEKLRYISGWAEAFDNTKRNVVRVSLNDIYEQERLVFGVTPTDAPY